MVEGQFGGVEEQAGQAERVAPGPVDAVTDQGMPDGRKMDADLVGPARLQPAVERQVGRQGVQFLDDLVFRAPGDRR